MCWLKDLVKIYQKLTIANNILLELEQLNQLPLYDFVYAKTSRKQKVFKLIATGKVRDENINFESNRTSSVSEKTQTKQSMLSPRVSSSHQIPNYHTNTKSKLNEYINKLTLLHFNSFCQSFNILFFQTIFDRCFFCCYKKLFFQLVHKKVIKIEKRLALNLPITSLFSDAQQKFHLVKHNLFSRQTYNCLTIIPVYLFYWLKRKIKSEQIDWL